MGQPFRSGLCKLGESGLCIMEQKDSYKTQPSNREHANGEPLQMLQERAFLT